MPNFIQKLFYKFSLVAPLLLVIGIVLVIETPENWCIYISLFALSIILILYLLFQFFIAKAHLSTIPVNANNVSENDQWLIAYIVTYFSPMITLAISDINIIALAIIAIIVVLLLAFINTSSPNIILCICRYHFYSISTDNGLNYTLITKRTIRNVNQIKVVRRMFEYILIDEGV